MEFSEVLVERAVDAESLKGLLISLSNDDWAILTVYRVPALGYEVIAVRYKE